MTPTDFEFTVTVPGDARLIHAVKQLAAQAAGYAQLSPDAGERFASQVELAIQASIASSPIQHPPIHMRFSADAHAIGVVISSDAVASAATPVSSSNGEVTVHWTTEGSRRTCHIRRPLPA